MVKFENSVEWKSFKTVRGSGKKIPILLQQLVTERAEEALASLEDELFHQGWRPSAAMPAISSIVSLLPHITEDIQTHLIELLLSLAIGFEDECLGEDGTDGSIYYDENLYLEAQSRCVPQIISLLSSGELRLRIQACRFLAWFPAKRQESLPFVRKMTMSKYKQEQQTSIITRGLLKDDIDLYTDSGLRILYASNAAFCETHNVSEKNLEIFLDMCTWRHDPQSDELGAFENSPFGFSLGQYAAEVICQKGPDVVNAFLRRAEDDSVSDRGVSPVPGFEPICSKLIGPVDDVRYCRPA